MKDKEPCAYTAVPHHSKDRLEVYHGRPEPVILCGLHAQGAFLKDVLAFVTKQGAEARK
ncbi:hypothetical protein ACFOOK_26350 [Micromonospora krabiensis]|uniref:Uncharacterized protein n=1 Tax=Micromonospora krabiensis TaxID=307121 RepID=A0A1C3N5R4_9ACTN|nr:hypothetical protein [Micromonospora krabiensis]SBV27911.1 hypothetical protein GA0070620_3442 [Micromonospora krabiensis]